MFLASEIGCVGFVQDDVADFRRLPAKYGCSRGIQARKSADPC
jgi:hypothetical protein